MKETEYIIQKESAIFIVMKHNKVVSKGFTDIESALHSIWVLNGKKENNWYWEKDGVVYLDCKDPYISGFEVEV